ncbi:alpha/beta hydrolase [Phreatobacter stygius]|uniref:Alpha/beta hydrolase n=1 Tax=Phreatobacter stygius TaxID=1940610 RepID=A0A4D7AV70_9HYPH|nr:alpha/beta hydrolase [Phreatobacter stygius]QCI62903.1 alpha/beta hydrolase [Phreatobacter stygius]
MTITRTNDTILNGTADPMRVRIYRGGRAERAAPLVLHLHGGAFVGGTLDDGAVISTLLAEAGAVVVSLDYPLAPGNPFPYALEASYRALVHLYDNRAALAAKSSRLYVAGEESGGNIASALALMARDQQSPPLAGQILLSPMLDPCLASGSIRDADAGPVGCKWADGWQGYLGSADKAAHPYAAPLGSSRLGDLAPALVLTAEDDPMRDESLRYADRLDLCGVSAERDVLAAPTGWPCALGGCGDLKAPWVSELRQRFALFFAETAHRRASASAPLPVRA